MPGYTLRNPDLGPVMDFDQVLKMACPLCRTAFEVRAGDHVVDKGVHWESSMNDTGTLHFDLEVLIEHTCPEGTTVTGTLA